VTFNNNDNKTLLTSRSRTLHLRKKCRSQRLSGYNALLRGYATPTSTISQYQAQPSGLQQLAGLGTTAAGIGTIAGMGKKEGGAIKLAEGGGITDTDALESFAERLVDSPDSNSQCRMEN
jgi:hypothetical protein